MSTETNVLRTDDPVAGADAFSIRTKGNGDATQGMHLDAEVQGDILVWYASAALEISADDIGSGAARLFKVDCVLDSGQGPAYLQVFDALTPTGTPVLRAFIPAGGQVSPHPSVVCATA